MLRQQKPADNSATGSAAQSELNSELLHFLLVPPLCKDHFQAGKDPKSVPPGIQQHKITAKAVDLCWANSGDVHICLEALHIYTRLLIYKSTQAKSFLPVHLPDHTSSASWAFCTLTPFLTDSLHFSGLFLLCRSNQKHYFKLLKLLSYKTTPSGFWLDSIWCSD